MTQAEWDACADPRRMLEFLDDGGSASERKIRLFAAAACRRVWRRLRSRLSRRAVEVAELFADGQATEQEREAADSDGTRAKSPGAVAMWVCEVNPAPNGWPWWLQFHHCATAAGVTPADHAALLREVFGSPFRPAVGPGWQARGDVVKLARAAYDDRRLPEGTLDNARLAILADALEEGGYPDAEALAHLRSPGPHVRGCFALDAVLGRS